VWGWGGGGGANKEMVLLKGRALNWLERANYVKLSQALDKNI
jgi:hypothetical protein